MLDGKIAAPSGDNKTLDWCESLQDRCELSCFKIARFFKVEDLARSTLVHENNSMVEMEDIDTLRVRKESQQLIRLARGCALYFMCLCLAYLFQTSICWMRLSQTDVQSHFSSRPEIGIEVYQMIDGICIMNIVHALTLFTLAFFMLLFTRRFKILNEQHYLLLGTLTLLITIVYFIPVLIVCYSAYSHGVESENHSSRGGTTRFFDMVFYIFMKSEMGVAGFVLACVIHAQLYFLLFVNMWCAAHIKDLCDKIQKLKEQNSGTYQGLELKSTDAPSMTFGSSEAELSYALDEDQNSLKSESEGAQLIDTAL